MRHFGSTLERVADTPDSLPVDQDERPTKPFGSSLPPPTGPAFAVPAPEGPAHRWRKWASLAAAIVLIGGGVAVYMVMTRPQAEFAVTTVDLPDIIVADESFEASAVVRNNGDSKGTRELTLLMDGAPVATATVELEAGDETTVKFVVEGVSQGNHDFAVKGYEAITTSARALTPASLVIDKVTVTPETIDPSVDPAVTVTVQLSNIGEEASSFTLALLLDGSVARRQVVSLRGGGSDEVVFTLNVETPGRHRISVEGAYATLVVLAPAELTIDSLVVAPNPADLTWSPDVTVTAQVSNTGDVEGTFTMNLSLDGAVAESRDITLTGGDTVTQEFVVRLGHPGQTVITLNGVEATFDVYQLQRPNNGTVVVKALGSGSNRLTINNQRSQDAYVVLTAVDGEQTLLGVYVRADSSYTVRGIPSGTYTAYFVHGQSWCSFYQRFTADGDYGKFDDIVQFQSTSSTYTVITLWFGLTDGSGSPTTSLNPDAFPTP